jgi:hypothetical protein
MKRSRTIVALAICAAGVAAGGGVAAIAGPADSSDPNRPECMCRFEGQRYHLGEFACINSKLARCDMFLNNTSWTFLEDVCPTASYTPAQESYPFLRATYHPVAPPRN